MTGPNLLGTGGMDELARIWIRKDWQEALRQCISEDRFWRYLL